LFLDTIIGVLISAPFFHRSSQQLKLFFKPRRHEGTEKHKVTPCLTVSLCLRGSCTFFHSSSQQQPKNELTFSTKLSQSGELLATIRGIATINFQALKKVKKKYILNQEIIKLVEIFSRKNI
jgi:hypothetical protein